LTRSGCLIAPVRDRLDPLRDHQATSTDAEGQSVALFGSALLEEWFDFR
jgi:hypothetical protein